MHEIITLALPQTHTFLPHHWEAIPRTLRPDTPWQISTRLQQQCSKQSTWQRTWETTVKRDFLILNKSAQGNLGRRPHRGAVANVRSKVPIGYNFAPQFRPQKYPFPWTDPQTPLPSSCLDPSNGPTYDAKRHPNLIRRFSTMHWTGRRTDRPTDRPRESLTTIGRCATKATRPNHRLCINVQLNNTIAYMI